MKALIEISGAGLFTLFGGLFASLIAQPIPAAAQLKGTAGFGGCNRFTGTYQQNGDRLTFGKMAMTFMACTEEMDTERDFAAALEQVRSWKILGDHLELFDSSGSLLARLEARAPK